VSHLSAARVTFAAALLALIALPATPSRADVTAGMLSCHASGNTTFIVVSSRSLDCIFTPTTGGPAQHYTANVQRFGAQVGFTSSIELGWAVLAATSHVGSGALAGTYGGVSGGAAIGVGAGANVLVGGVNNSFALQPLSLEGQTGLNVIATVTGVQLQAGPAGRHHWRHKH
jgi:hypothetical protein